MHSHPLPDADEVRDNATFEAILWAFSRPGEIRTLPEPGEAAIALALVDRECVVHTDDADLERTITATGARSGSAAEADHAFLLHATTVMQDVARLPAGSALYPDDGATVVLRVRIGSGPVVTLSGPGIPSRTTVRIGGLPEGFWALRAARCRYPEGIDLILVDGDKVLGVPRSSHVETD